MTLIVSTIDGMTNWSTEDALSFETNFISVEGVVVQTGTDLQVQAQSVPDLTVKVKKGVAYVKRDAYVTASGGIKFWLVVDDADSNVVIPSNSSGGTIKRIICLKVDTAATPGANGESVATLVVVSGTSGGGDPTIPDNHLPLARVNHTNGDTTIASGDIEEMRAYVGFLASGGFQMPDSTGANDGRLYEDSTDNVVFESQIQGSGIRLNTTYDNIQAKTKSTSDWSPVLSDLVTVTDGATVTFDLKKSRLQKVVIAGNRTIAFSNVVLDKPFTLIITQDATGGRTLTWPANVHWADNVAPVLSTGASKSDLFAFIPYDVATVTHYIGLIVSQNH